ncbi:hypothetical protein Mar181_1095 [Marinomonas posidonica IVIA-Po-181]|uniref:Uncharacterized protein n=1 Tax=Marinomonas posidonica (strain CECT 7376 / NCIMB 14433 / IVIA-Po-181) TaxID=491952 RepID=F6CUN3_MARPP|nr:hypothetical protein Mar181_1095 [Marinomonas posidonica IVIA-Po-181]
MAIGREGCKVSGFFHIAFSNVNACLKSVLIQRVVHKSQSENVEDKKELSC